MSLQMCYGICEEEMSGFKFFGTQYGDEVCTLKSFWSSCLRIIFTVLNHTRCTLRFKEADS